MHTENIFFFSSPRIDLFLSKLFLEARAVFQTGTCHSKLVTFGRPSRRKKSAIWSSARNRQILLSTAVFAMLVSGIYTHSDLIPSRFSDPMTIFKCEPSVASSQLVTRSYLLCFLVLKLLNHAKNSFYLPRTAITTKTTSMISALKYHIINLKHYSLGNKLFNVSFKMSTCIKYLIWKLSWIQVRWFDIFFS